MFMIANDASRTFKISLCSNSVRPAVTMIMIDLGAVSLPSPSLLLIDGVPDHKFVVGPMLELVCLLELAASPG